MVAFAAFLQSEKERHQEDIDMIEAKLTVLRSLGVEPQGTAPWIETKDLYAACKQSVLEAQTARAVITYQSSEKEDYDIYEEELEFYPLVSIHTEEVEPKPTMTVEELMQLIREEHEEEEYHPVQGRLCSERKVGP
jgi:hypothetical protein